MKTLTLYGASVITCVGLSAKETASSVRAGISNCAEDDYWPDSETCSVILGNIPWNHKVTTKSSKPTTMDTE
jgi:hypothetical protein